MVVQDLPLSLCLGWSCMRGLRVKLKLNHKPLRFEAELELLSPAANRTNIASFSPSRVEKDKDLNGKVGWSVASPTLNGVGGPWISCIHGGGWNRSLLWPPDLARFVKSFLLAHENILEIAPLFLSHFQHL